MKKYTNWGRCLPPRWIKHPPWWNAQIENSALSANGIMSGSSFYPSTFPSTADIWVTCLTYPQLSGWLSVPTEECFQAWVARKTVTFSPGIKKYQFSGLSVRPANGMSSVLNIQSLFFFSIHPRGKTNILPSCRVSYHMQTGLFRDRRGGVGGRGRETRLGGPLKNLQKQFTLRLPKLHRIIYWSFSNYRHYLTQWRNLTSIWRHIFQFTDRI